MDGSDFKRNMQVLRENYESNLPVKINEIKSRWNACVNTDVFSEDVLADMRFQLHKLAGSGATFGYPMVSDIAERIELLLSLLIDTHTGPSQTQKDQIHFQLLCLSTMNFTSRVKGRIPEQSDDVRVATAPDVEHRVLYIMEDDVAYAEYLGMELSNFGFEPHLFSMTADFEQACHLLKPDVVLMDMALNEGSYEGAKSTLRINTGESKLVPVVFMSVNDSFKSRLTAVRAGATHFFKKPIDIELMAETLEDVSKLSPIKPYRVLIIDDDKELGEVYRLSLESAGMVVSLISDPLQSLDVLKNFQPDLILIDVMMPGCNGLELATIIRQYHEYDLTPIVFLTTELRNDMKLSELNMGSDDFLAKPIAPWYLVENLKARIKRARILRAGTEKIKKF